MWDNRATDTAWSTLQQFMPTVTQFTRQVIRNQQQPGHAAMLHIARAASDAAQAAKAAAHGQAAKNGAKVVADELATATTAHVAGDAASKAASSDWWKLAAVDMSQRWADAQVQAQQLGDQVSAKMKVVAKKGIKIPGMKIDVDMLNPALATAKETMREGWDATPAPLREVVPYFAVGCVVATLVGRMYHERLTVERQRFDSLLERSQDMEAELAELRARSTMPSTARELELSEAVAKATTAAASAATAASAAAQVAGACALFQAQHLPGLNGMQGAGKGGQQQLQQQSGLLAPGYGAMQPGVGYAVDTITVPAPPVPKAR